jgi:hypothetical protein
VPVDGSYRGFAHEHGEAVVVTASAVPVIERLEIATAVGAKAGLGDALELLVVG